LGENPEPKAVTIRVMQKRFNFAISAI
jgi:hypothetical protein